MSCVLFLLFGTKFAINSSLVFYYLISQPLEASGASLLVFNGLQPTGPLQGVWLIQFQRAPFPSTVDIFTGKGNEFGNCTDTLSLHDISKHARHF